MLWYKEVKKYYSAGPTWWENLWRWGWWKSPTSSPAWRAGPACCAGRPSVSWHLPKWWPSATVWLGCLGTVGLSSGPPDASSQTAVKFQTTGQTVKQAKNVFLHHKCSLTSAAATSPRQTQRAGSCWEEGIWSEQSSHKVLCTVGQHDGRQ